MAEEELIETPQRWTARRRAALVLSLLREDSAPPQSGPPGTPGSCLRAYRSCSKL
jgi:hypothetical protein